MLTKTTLDDEIDKEFGNDGKVEEDGDYWVISVNGVEIERVNKTSTEKRTIKFYLKKHGETEAPLEIEIEAGTTWYKWSNDSTMQTGNNYIDKIRSIIASQSEGTQLNGVYKGVVGEETRWGIAMFDGNNYIGPSSDEPIEPDGMYEYSCITRGIN